MRFGSRGLVRSNSNCTALRRTPILAFGSARVRWRTWSGRKRTATPLGMLGGKDAFCIIDANWRDASAEPSHMLPILRSPCCVTYRETVPLLSNSRTILPTYGDAESPIELKKGATHSLRHAVIV